MTIRRITRDLWRNQHGIALPMVLVIFLIGFALVGAFMVAIVGSANVSNTTRSGIQAQAAAEAGVAAVRAASNPCASPAPQSASGVVYQTAVTCNLAASQPTATIKSTGSASNGTTAIVEAVINLTVTTTGGGTVPLYTAQNMTLNGNADIRAVSSSNLPNLYVDGRDFTCDGSASIAGSVYVNGGGATIGGSCVIKGDVKATGNVSVGGGGKIEGAIESQGNVELSGWSGIHAAKVMALGNVTLEGSAQSPTVNAGKAITMSGQTRVDVATYGTTVSLSGSASIGSQSKASVTVPLPPVAPPFPEMSKAQILAAHPALSWTRVTWSGNCAIGGTHAMKTLIQGATQRLVIDATACSEVSFESNSTITIPVDVTFISQAFDLGTYNLESSSSTVRTLRFMVPAEQSCANGAGTIATNNFKFSSTRPLLALAYSKCGVSLSNGSNAYWPGTVMTKNFTGTPLMDFSPVPLDPTSTGGGGSGGTTTITAGSIVSQRNVR